MELAAGDFRVVASNKEVEKKESDEFTKTAPKKNSGATDGGILSR